VAKVRFIHSVVTRLVACLVVGGIVLSVGLAVLELRRAEPVLQMKITQRVSIAARDLRDAVRVLMPQGDRAAIGQTINAFSSDASVVAVHLQLPDGGAFVNGPWDELDLREASVFTIPRHGFAGGVGVDLDRLTLVKAPLVHDGQVAMLQMVVDGPAARSRMRAGVLSELTGQWVLLATMTLVGLLLVRRWFIDPLSQVLRHVADGDGPEAFSRLAERVPGEFSHLSSAIGGMLTRLEQTTDQLKRREEAFQSLYQFAPSAMVSLDPAGRVIEANHRAAELFHVDEERQLMGQPVMSFVRTEDRARLRQAIDRLDVHAVTRAELRVVSGDRTIDVATECVGVRNDVDELTSVRLSFVDVSQSKALQRRLADKGRLLNLIIDNMSDAIVLIDADGKVAAHNQRLAALLHRRWVDLVGNDYDTETFWEELGVIDQDLFVNRLRQIESDHSRPAQERFETQVGVFVFQGIPVQDDATQSINRLWVVQELTSQEQNERLLTERVNQLTALKQLGRGLSHVYTVDDLLYRATDQLLASIGVEAVGMAVRDSDLQSRTVQMINRGGGSYLLEPNQQLVEQIERTLLPQILSSEEVAFWPELPRRQPWADAFTHAGLTSVAACPLQGSGDAEGIIWIARRGGEHIERYQLHMLEALGPIVAARLEHARGQQILGTLQLADPVTDLPSRSHLALTILARVGSIQPWSVCVLRIGNFDRVERIVGEEAADELLVRISRVFRRQCRKSALVAAIDRGTFAVLGINTDRDAARRLSQRLIDAVSDVEVRAYGAPLEAGAGIAHHAPDDMESVELIEHAVAYAAIAVQRGGGAIVDDRDPALQHAG